MEYTKLGKSELEVTKIGLGTWQFGTEGWGFGKDFDRNDAINVVKAAIDSGINWIDTAEAYGGGESERIISEALGSKINDVIIATKVSGPHFQKNDLLKAAEGSLKRLNRDWIDLYQLHWVNGYVPSEEVAEALQLLLEQGKVRYVGVSNYPPELIEPLRNILGDKLITNQVRYNLLDRSIEKAIKPYCLKHQIHIIAFSPLAMGMLTGKYNRDHLPSDAIRSGAAYFWRKNLDRALKIVELLSELAEKYGKSIPQVALRWLIQQDGVVAIPGAKKVEHVVNNAGAMGWALDDDDWKRLEEASRGELSYYFEE